MEQAGNDFVSIIFIPTRTAVIRAVFMPKWVDSSFA